MQGKEPREPLDLAMLTRLDNCVGCNGIFKVPQRIAYPRKHAFPRRFAEEFRDSEQIVAGIELHTKVVHQIESLRFAQGHPIDKLAQISYAILQLVYQ